MATEIKHSVTAPIQAVKKPCYSMTSYPAGSGIFAIMFPLRFEVPVILPLLICLVCLQVLDRNTCAMSFYFSCYVVSKAVETCDFLPTLKARDTNLSGPPPEKSARRSQTKI